MVMLQASVLVWTGAVVVTTFAVKLNVPASNGVPVIAPFDVFSIRPVGKLPD